jgi:hypothetical protein
MQMSPHAVNSLVTDLVEMAKAVELVPTLEAEIARLKGIEADLTQAKEYAASLEQRLHNAEVARDDAEMRFLEADDAAHKAIGVLNQIMGYSDSIQSQVRNARDLIDPPKPQPEPVSVQVDPTPFVNTQETPSASVPRPSAFSPDVATSGTPEGQSESLPTTDHPSTMSGGLGTDLTETDTKGQSDPFPTVTSATEHGQQDVKQTQDGDALPITSSSGPYTAKRYIDHPYYVSLEGWLAGGGTEYDYYRHDKAVS